MSLCRGNVCTSVAVVPHDLSRNREVLVTFGAIPALPTGKPNVEADRVAASY